jgi:hypothetical protein
VMEVSRPKVSVDQMLHNSQKLWMAYARRWWCRLTPGTSESWAVAYQMSCPVLLGSRKCDVTDKRTDRYNYSSFCLFSWTRPKVICKLYH